VDAGQAAALGRAWLGPLVLAILVGTLARSLWTPASRWLPGIHCSAKFLLEMAVVLLGASVSAATVWAVGPGLLAGIAAVVLAAIATSCLIGACCTWRRAWRCSLPAATRSTAIPRSRRWRR